MVYIYIPANQRPRKTWSFQWTSFTYKRTYFTWVDFCQSSVDAVDKCVLSTNHCKSFSQLVEFQGSRYQLYCLVIAFNNCPQPVKVHQQPKTSRETPVNHPWNTREATVKHPWSTREWSGDAQWTCINGQIASIFAGSQYQIQSAIALFLKTTHVCMNQVSLKTDSKQWLCWSVDSTWLERLREVIGERNFKRSS